MILEPSRTRPSDRLGYSRALEPEVCDRVGKHITLAGLRAMHGVEDDKNDVVSAFDIDGTVRGMINHSPMYSTIQHGDQ